MKLLCEISSHDLNHDFQYLILYYEHYSPSLYWLNYHLINGINLQSRGKILSLLTRVGEKVSRKVYRKKKFEFVSTGGFPAISVGLIILL